MTRDVTVRAAEGAGFALRRDDTIAIVNTSGTQVVDLWCLAASDPVEHLSMGHCREVLGKIHFDPGDVLVSDRYTPMLAYEADSAGGLHDTLIAACSVEMYRRFGRDPGHPSCAGNFAQAAAGFGIALPFTPQPWNLFMRAAVQPDGRIDYERPPLQPGAAVTLRLLCDAIVIVSACPDDCYPTNGGDGSPRDISILIQPAAA